MKVLQSILMTALLVAPTVLWAKGASENMSAASKHSMLAAGHATASVGQVASGVVAVPLLAVGSVGAVSLVAADSLLNVASGVSEKNMKNSELEISDVTITVDRSPAETMNQ